MPCVRQVSLRLRHIVSFAHRCPSATNYASPNIFSPRRSIHHLRELPYNVEHGLGDFLSPPALRVMAVDYQQGLLDRLNEQVKGTELEGQSVTDTVISSASHRRHALVFNYASQALNNSFFLECLRPPPPSPATNEDELLQSHFMQEIRLHFGSLAQLKSTFSSAALGMINSGWVWLVSDENGHMEVVATFGAGTLLVRSRTHMSTSDLPILGEPYGSRYKGASAGRRLGGAPLTEASTQSYHSTRPPSHDPSSTTLPTSGLQQSTLKLPPSIRSRTLHTSPIASQFGTPLNIFSPGPLNPTAQSEKSRTGQQFDELGDILTPLLCVSVHEHAWVGTGYGVWGKEEYLKRFWTVVNWKRVASAFDRARQLR